MELGRGDQRGMLSVEETIKRFIAKVTRDEVVTGKGPARAMDVELVVGATMDLIRELGSEKDTKELLLRALREAGYTKIVETVVERQGDPNIPRQPNEDRRG